jgi:hypothetical protein
MTITSSVPRGYPKFVSPDEAAYSLRNSGIPEEIWPRITTEKTYSHLTRMLIDIALGTETVDVEAHFQKLFGEEDHAPERVQYIKEMLD